MVPFPVNGKGKGGVRFLSLNLYKCLERTGVNQDVDFLARHIGRHRGGGTNGSGKRRTPNESYQVDNYPELNTTAVHNVE